jgi:hypothetical protein
MIAAHCSIRSTSESKGQQTSYRQSRPTSAGASPTCNLFANPPAEALNHSNCRLQLALSSPPSFLLLTDLLPVSRTTRYWRDYSLLAGLLRARRRPLARSIGNCVMRFLALRAAPDGGLRFGSDRACLARLTDKACLAAAD